MVYETHEEMDRVRNKGVRKNLKVCSLKETIKKKQLKWFGHVSRIKRKIMEFRPVGSRPRGMFYLELEYIEKLGEARER